MRVFLDIETLPPEESERARLTFGILRRLERRAQADEFCDDDLCTDEEFRRLALHGEYGRVLCIGVIVEREGLELLRGVYGRDRRTQHFHLDEARTLRGFWNMLRNFNVQRDQIIGHNVLEFDLPFLLKRSMIWNVPATVQLSFARYRRQPIYDTLKEWTHWDMRRSIALSELAKILKVELAKTCGMDGKRVYEAFCEDQHDEIASYCLRDVEIVQAIYRRMTFMETELERSE
jgi:DNA polymerase elongation subunit (family B)